MLNAEMRRQSWCLVGIGTYGLTCVLRPTEAAEAVGYEGNARRVFEE